MPRSIWEQTNGRAIKVEPFFTKGRRQSVVTFSYEVQGNRYEGELYTFSSMEVGESLIVTYDALNPGLTKFADDHAQTWRIWQIVIFV